MHTKLGWSNEKEKRLRRLGLIMGLVLALFFHALIFFGPRVSYSPALEKAKIKKVLVARPYRPRPQQREIEVPIPTRTEPVVKPKKDTGGGSEIKGVKEDVAKDVKVTEVVEKSTVAEPAERAATDAYGRADAIDTGVRDDPPAIDDTPVPPSPDEEAKSENDWDKMLSLLEQQKSEMSAREAQLKAEREKLDRVEEEKAARQTAEEKEEEDALLDSRIEIKVTSYPRTTIEDTYPYIPYPDMEVRQSQLKSGICRVYYRVWLNEGGKIIRSQLKTPSTSEEKKKYAIFIDTVMRNVDQWKFPYTEAEVHIDVRFEIE